MVLDLQSLKGNGVWFVSFVFILFLMLWMEVKPHTCKTRVLSLSYTLSPRPLLVKDIYNISKGFCSRSFSH